MNLNPLGPNKTELNLGNRLVLFSYKTPVAMLDAHTGIAYKTSKTWSSTTTRHINSWLTNFPLQDIKIEAQEYFDNLVAEVK